MARLFLIQNGGVEALFRPVSDLIDKLAGPLATEIGMIFGDAARVYRFKRALKLLEKVQQIAAECGYDPAAVRPKILLPILDHASVEDDDGLHDRWAALLANACNPNSDVAVLPSFPEILSAFSAIRRSTRLKLEVLRSLG